MTDTEKPKPVTESPNPSPDQREDIPPTQEDSRTQREEEKRKIDGNLATPGNPEEGLSLSNIGDRTREAIDGNRLPQDYDTSSEEEQRKIMEDKQKHPELYKMFEGVSFFLAGFLPQASAEDTANFPDTIIGKLMVNLPDSVKDLITKWGKVLFNDDEQETEDSLKQYDSLNADGYRRGIFERYANKSRIVKEALDICGSTQFRGPEVAYGRLACAQVATEILRRAGYLSGQILSVDGAASELKRRGWQVHSSSESPQAGWVVVWNRTANRSSNGEIVAGHGHIGVVISDEGQCVSNSSNKKTPRIHNVNYSRRGVAMFLSPPEVRAA